MTHWIARLRARRKARFVARYQSAISDIRLALQQEATQSTARYVREHMYRVQSVDSWRAVQDVAIEHVRLNGLVLEFGVYKARTTAHIAGRRDWQVHGFDSFDGLPEPWRDGYPRATFALPALPEVPANVTLHKGLFADTLPGFLAALPAPPDPVAYLHVDSDLYSSAKCIFEHLADRIVPGTVIVFDEYFNYSGWEQGEFRAFQEFVAARGVGYDYLCYNHEHQQVAVQIT